MAGFTVKFWAENLAEKCHFCNGTHVGDSACILVSDVQGEEWTLQYYGLPRGDGGEELICVSNGIEANEYHVPQLHIY